MFGILNRKNDKQKNVEITLMNEKDNFALKGEYHIENYTIGSTERIDIYESSYKIDEENDKKVIIKINVSQANWYGVSANSTHEERFIIDETGIYKITGTYQKEVKLGNQTIYVDEIKKERVDSIIIKDKNGKPIVTAREDERGFTVIIDVKKDKIVLGIAKDRQLLRQ